jgi:hypothetical protein
MIARYSPCTHSTKAVCSSRRCITGIAYSQYNSMTTFKRGNHAGDSYPFQGGFPDTQRGWCRRHHLQGGQHRHLRGVKHGKCPESCSRAAAELQQSCSRAAAERQVNSNKVLQNSGHVKDKTCRAANFPSALGVAPSARRR